MREILISFATALATAVGGTLVAWLLARVRSGRFARTLDQATKVIGFVERCSAVYDGLAKISEVKRDAIGELMSDAVQAVREDFAAERAVLPEFKETTSAVRSAWLLYLPQRTIMWLPFLVFHTLLFFMLYVFVVRLVQGRWGIEDTAVLIIAGVCAAIARLTVRLVPKPG